MKNKYLEFSPFFFVEKENLYLLRLVPIFGAVAPDLFARDQGRLSHPLRLKAAPFMQQQHGYGKRKKKQSMEMGKK